MLFRSDECEPFETSNHDHWEVINARIVMKPMKSEDGLLYNPSQDPTLLKERAISGYISADTVDSNDSIYDTMSDDSDCSSSETGDDLTIFTTLGAQEFVDSDSNDINYNPENRSPDSESSGGSIDPTTYAKPITRSFCENVPVASSVCNMREPFFPDNVMKRQIGRAHV